MLTTTPSSRIRLQLVTPALVEGEAEEDAREDALYVTNAAPHCELMVLIAFCRIVPLSVGVLSSDSE